MKKSKKEGKLQLNRQTIRELTPKQLDNVVGGMDDTGGAGGSGPTHVINSGG